MYSALCLTKMLKSMSVLICIVTPVLLGVSLQGCGSGSAEDAQLEKTPSTTTTTTPTPRPLNPRTSIDLDLPALGFSPAVVEGCPAACMECHPGEGKRNGTALDNKTCTHHCANPYGDMRRCYDSPHTVHTVDCTGCPKTAARYNVDPIRIACDAGKSGMCPELRIDVSCLDVPLGSKNESKDAAGGEFELSCVANSSAKICPDTIKSVVSGVSTGLGDGNGVLTSFLFLKFQTPREWVDTPIEMCFTATYQMASGLAYSSPPTCFVSQLIADPGGPYNDQTEIERTPDSSFIEAVQQPRNGMTQGTVPFVTSKERPRKIGVGRHLPQGWAHK